MDKPVEELLDLTVLDLSMIKLLEPQSEKKGFHQVGPQWYYTDENGNKLFGLQEIDGKLYYLDNTWSVSSVTGFLTKDEVLSPEQKESSRYPRTSSSTIIKPKLYSYYYFDPETGAAVTNQFVNWKATGTTSVTMVRPSSSIKSSMVNTSTLIMKVNK